MKTMKKVLTLLLGVAMILSFAGACAGATVSGTDGDLANGKDSDVKVTYTQTGSYEVSLPESIALSKDAVTSTDVEVTKLEIASDKYLRVSVSSANGWKVVDSTSSSEITYMMGYHSGYATSGKYFTGTSEGKSADDKIPFICVEMDYFPEDNGGMYFTKSTSNLYFKMTGNADYGNYEDTLTFTISLSDSDAYDLVSNSEPDWFTTN